MTTVLAFVLALGLLIAIHEYGHYRVAVACGIRVLRFSIGFGRPVLRWRLRGNPTEFVIGLLPLGGYVRMLDEREAPVEASQRHLAFNTQPLRSRVAVVAAGPLANLLLAAVLYAAVSWIGVEEPQAIVSTPAAGSVAERAGLRSGDWVLQAASQDEEAEPVRSFDDLRWRLAQAALEGQRLLLVVQAQTQRGQGSTREVWLDLGGFERAEANAQLFRDIGVVSPWSRPVMGQVQAGGAADKAGLQAGDLVLGIDGRRIDDAASLREIVRQSTQSAVQLWQIDRRGQPLQLSVQPQLGNDGVARIGRIGAFIGEPAQKVLVRQDALQASWEGLSRTWEVSALTVRMIGKMLIGEASLKNLSGPLTIADYAGKSAQLGWVSYLLFLAMISVSLGVLNLLPLPMLDGGHLMYYLWEGITGRSVSEIWMERLQRVGMAALLLLMSIALFNDVTRLFG